MDAWVVPPVVFDKQCLPGRQVGHTLVRGQNDHHIGFHLNRAQTAGERQPENDEQSQNGASMILAGFG